MISMEVPVPHIPTPDGVPGIRGLLAFKPASGATVAALIEQLMRGASTLRPEQREQIAVRVSTRNRCEFCARSHAATLRHLRQDAPRPLPAGGDASAGPVPAGADTVDSRVGGSGPAAPAIPTGGPEPVGDARMAALLTLAEAVADGGDRVTAAHVAAARAAGAGDEDIHDTVLVAAAFCMLNRYVDALAASTPTDETEYDMMGVHLAAHGYLGAAPRSS